MPILLYCIAKSGVHIKNPICGVARSEVNCAEIGSLAVFTSRNSDNRLWLQRDVRTSAVEFHGVLKQIFESAAIIPFRFPTIFEERDDLEKHLQEKGAAYGAQLAKFAGMVQMELRIAHATLHEPSGSGTDYLKRRRDSISDAERVAENLKQATSSFTSEWRQRGLKDGVRAFALVNRGSVAEFESAIGNASIPTGLNVRVSGPWPVGEFLEIS